MKWTKSYTSDLENFKIEELKARHKAGGIAFRETLIKVLAKHLNPYVPCYYRFPKRIFFAFFDGIVCKNTAKVILKFLSEMDEVYHGFNSHEIFIIAPLMEERVDEYAKKVQKGSASISEQIKKWQNEAVDLHGSCLKFVRISDNVMALPDIIKTGNKGDTT